MPRFRPWEKSSLLLTRKPSSATPFRRESPRSTSVSAIGSRRDRKFSRSKVRKWETPSPSSTKRKRISSWPRKTTSDKRDSSIVAWVPRRIICWPKPSLGRSVQSGYGGEEAAHSWIHRRTSSRDASKLIRSIPSSISMHPLAEKSWRTKLFWELWSTRTPRS